MPSGTNTPDAVFSSFEWRIAARMERLRRRDAAGRMVREPRRGPFRSRPPPKRRFGPEARGPACRLWWGSRQRPSTRSPSSHGTPVAVPSHKNGRSPIAARSPLGRHSGRSPGGCPATRAGPPGHFPTRAELISPPPRSFFSCMDVFGDCSGSPLFQAFFSDKQAGLSPLAVLC